MKVLVIGGGGREHAIVWKLLQSPRVRKVYCAPGNAGIAGLAACVDLGGSQDLLSFARKEGIDLTIVGPEAPLVAGIVDAFQAEKMPIFGPRKEGAILEASKAFTKDFLQRHAVPTAGYETFDDYDKARDFVLSRPLPVVLKADGLAAGKGVLICQSESEALQGLDQILRRRIFGDAGRQVVIEDFLAGTELSYHVVVAGSSFLPLASSQDHKRVGDGDQGPNTGGMGAYSPAPFLTPELEQKVHEEILAPTVRGLEKEGRLFQGVLYAGLMLTAEGPKLLEYNVRFGDPETEVLMMRLESDLVDLIEAVLAGKLSGYSLRWKSGASVTVVMAARGYPATVQKGDVIEGLEAAGSVPETVVFHAGTAAREGRMVTSGGRVLAVTSQGADMDQARRRVYEACGKIHWDGVHYRKDIGTRTSFRSLS